MTRPRTEDITGGELGVDGEFDLICSFCVFHLLPNPTLVLHNLKGHLRESGKLLAVYPTGKNLAFFEAAGETFHAFEMKAPWERGPSGPTKMAMRTLEGSAQVFVDAEWEIETIREVHTPHAFYDRQELIDWLLGPVSPTGASRQRSPVPSLASWSTEWPSSTETSSNQMAATTTSYRAFTS